MKNIKILLVDDNQLWLNTLKYELNKHSELDVYAVNSGIKALETITENPFDMVISGIVMYGMDGFALVDGIKRLRTKQPKVMFMSLFCNDDIIKRAADVGVAYFFRKPVSAQNIYDRLHSFVSDTANVNIDTSTEKIVGKTIKTFGISANLSGYKFIRDIVTLFVKNGETSDLVMKKIYSTIAEKYATTESRVQRLIHTAIDSAWHKADKNAIIEVFGNTIDKDKPTNSEFVAAIAEKVRIDLKKDVCTN